MAVEAGSATERHVRERALVNAALDDDPEDVRGAVRRFLSDWFELS